ncbi:hypothetical protein STRMOE7_25410 [Streptomyces sp. MOE7]|nr:hypothetical protein STRMOE7_25410 [Streptomyces sp. MOE7]
MRPVVHRAGRALPDAPPGPHDRDPVADRPHDGRVVGDEDRRRTRFAAQVAERLHDLRREAARRT